MFLFAYGRGRLCACEARAFRAPYDEHSDRALQQKLQATLSSPIMLVCGSKAHAIFGTGTHRPANRRNAVARPIECSSSSSNGASRQTTIHRLIQENGALMVPGVHDALSAKALYATGHSAAFVSGYAVSTCTTGPPDAALNASQRTAASLYILSCFSLSHRCPQNETCTLAAGVCIPAWRAGCRPAYAA